MIKIYRITISIIFLLLLLLTIHLGFSYFFSKYINRPLCENCNVILLDIDIFRGDYVSCNGDNKRVTPNICKFFENSLIFENNISQSYWTFPSFFSTITSLYIPQHNMDHMYSDILNPNITTIGQALSQNGYSTVFVNSYEYDSIISLIKNGWDRGYLKTTDVKKPSEWKKIVENELNGKKPVFIHLFESGSLHFPYSVPEGTILNCPVPAIKGFPITEKEESEFLANYLTEYYREIFLPETIRKFPDLFQSPSLYKDEIMELFFSQRPPIYTLGRESWDVTNEALMSKVNLSDQRHIDFIRCLYKTNLSLLDNQLGELFDYLNSKGIKNNTIVIFSSSHGEELGERGKFSHDPSVVKEVLDVPLMIRIPKVFGRKIQTPSQNIDIPPTILELIGLPSEAQFQGKGLAELIKEPNRDGERFAVSHTSADPDQTSIQNEEWKLKVIKSGILTDFELYNLTNDPDETKDVSDDFPEVVLDLNKILHLEVNQSIDYPPQIIDDDAKIDEKVRQELMKQGYF